MRKHIYRVRSGGYSEVAKSFQLSDTYFSSKVRAVKEYNSILEVNRATEKVDSFDGYPNLQNGYIKATDYIGEKGKYRARVLVEKVVIDNNY